MRVKELRFVMSIPTKLRFLWDRITLSRITTLYFVFSVVHCVLQLVFQTRAFVINAEAANALYQITLQGNATNVGFPVLGRDLRMCSSIPHSLNANSCPIFWDGTPGTENAWNSTSSISSPPSPTSLVPSSSDAATSVPRTVTVFSLPSATSSLVANAPPSFPTSASHQAVVNEHDLHERDDLGNVKIQSSQINGTTSVIVTGPGFSKPAVLERSCIFALNHPVFILQNTKREDIVFVAFQLWVLGMSTVALLNESMPHIIASLLTHVLATAWAAFQIVQTAHFRQDFIRLTTDGACKPINLLPSYWQRRRGAEVPLLVLNIVALLISAFLTRKLVKLFGWQTFKRVGASLTFQRIYKTMLVLSIILQLTLFFMAVSTSLWIDQLYNGPIGRLAKKAELYKALFLIILVLLIPWVMTGWVAIRRELKIPMLIFLILSIIYLSGLGFMFVSYAFRWTFLEWRFFSLIASASAVLIGLTFVLGVICRINFDKGLPHYLNAESSLPGDEFEPVRPSDIEKIDFPSNKEVIPPFNGAPYTSHAAVHGESLEASQVKSLVAVPYKVHLKTPSYDSTLSYDSVSSGQSFKAQAHDSDTHLHTTTGDIVHMSPTKRWVIE